MGCLAMGETEELRARLARYEERLALMQAQMVKKEHLMFIHQKIEEIKKQLGKLGE